MLSNQISSKKVGRPGKGLRELEESLGGRLIPTVRRELRAGKTLSQIAREHAFHSSYLSMLIRQAGYQVSFQMRKCEATVYICDLVKLRNGSTGRVKSPPPPVRPDPARPIEIM